VKHVRTKKHEPGRREKKGENRSAIRKNGGERKGEESVKRDEGDRPIEKGKHAKGDSRNFVALGNDVGAKP